MEDKVCLLTALLILLVALVFSAIEVSFGWLALKFFELAEKVR